MEARRHRVFFKFKPAALRVYQERAIAIQLGKMARCDRGAPLSVPRARVKRALTQGGRSVRGDPGRSDLITPVASRPQEGHL
jgi:hypothetical protein